MRYNYCNTKNASRTVFPMMGKRTLHTAGGHYPASVGCLGYSVLSFYGDGGYSALLYLPFIANLNDNVKNIKNHGNWE